MLTSRRMGSNSQLQNAATNSPPLRSGAKGDGVKIVQDVLADMRFNLAKSFAKGGPDGIFGQETEAAIKAYQKDKGLVPDGVAGAQTLKAMDADVAGNYRLEQRDSSRDAPLGYR